VAPPRAAALALETWLAHVLGPHAEPLRDLRQAEGLTWKENSPGVSVRARYVAERGQCLAELQASPEATRPRRPTFNDLPHTFATLALQTGVPLSKVSKMLGHRDISIALNAI